MKPPKIVMYVRPDCSDVELARAVLAARGATWDEVDIEQDPDAREQVQRWTGGRVPTPTLWIGERMLIEPDEEEIENALAQETK